MSWARNIARVVALLAASGFCGLMAARIASLGAGTPGYVNGALSSLMSGGFGAVASDPLGIAWADPVVFGTFCCVAGGTCAVSVVLAVRPSKHNIDTDNAHGDARMAGPGEKSDLVDKARPFNNIMFSEHMGIVLDAPTSRLKAKSRARNLNSIVLGISGLGKTYNCVLPDLMQSVGANLRPAKRGVKALASNVLRKASPAEWARAQARADARWERKRSAYAAKGFGGGYDVVHSDPKGDNLRDCGQMYLDAGYAVSVVDTVDFRSSSHYNPLVAIKPRWVDVCDADDIAITAPSVALGGVPMTAGEGLALRAAGSVRATSSYGNGIEFSMSFHPEVSEVSARDLLEEEARSRGEEFDADGVPAEVLSYTYRTTRGVLRLELANATEAPVDAEVRFALDRRLDWRMPSHDASVALEPFSADNGGDLRDSEFAWKVRLFPRCDADGFDGVTALEMLVEVKPMCVPDAVELAKVVNTLVANLGANHDPNGKAPDPFWENCKKLHFMSKISYLFERYYPQHGYKYVTIPCMIDLFDEDMPDSGNPSDPSCTSERIEAWEYGRIWRNDPPEIGGGETREPEAEEAHGDWEPVASLPHKRDRSLAIRCYRVLVASAADTFKSVVISTYAACVDLMGQEVREMLSYDEVGLDRLGELGQGHAVFLVFKDTDNPYEFIAALVMQQAIDSCCDRAYKNHGGRLPRHVRFVLDEAANLGTIPCLVRALAVVRSRNVSISMYLQSAAQLESRYGKNDAQAIFDCCSTLQFLGAQSAETLEMISKKIGDETVFTQVIQRSFKQSSLSADSSESLSASARRVRTPSQLAQMSTGEMLVFVYNHLPVQDAKQDPSRHPMFRYVMPGFKRTALMPASVHSERFDARAYLEAQRAGRRVEVAEPVGVREPAELDLPVQRGKRKSR